ncbi:DUF998 domain-containing protein [Leucobacter sp. Z1108]|uniref:DUF998 domain-containing protein n=1 Tax=unclassified Leucobacter TaxID=2621730 RepID=UPI003D9A090D
MTDRRAQLGTASIPLSERRAAEPQLTLRIESQAIYLALLAGGIGAIVGIILGIGWPPLPLFGDLSFGTVVAIVAGLVSAVAGSIGYWRARRLEGQEWRGTLPAAIFTVNTIAVVLVHVVLAALTVLGVFFILSRGFIGLEVDPFWSTALMAVSVGLSAHMTYLSVSRMTTRRMSSLLMSFVVIGTLTAMVSSPDPTWWKIHFSQLGTFWSVSGFMFNGTLIAAGLLVTAFAVYLANDMRALVERGILTNRRSTTIVSAMFIVMGIMLAGVGLVPVNVSLIIHNLCASGMAVMYFGLLSAGPWILRGMPRAYFVASVAFLVSVVLSTILFSIGFFGLTAFEIVVFALIFGWISVFIRFVGVAGQDDARRANGSDHRVPPHTRGFHDVQS